MPTLDQVLDALRRYRLQVLAGGGLLAIVAVVIIVVLLATGGDSDAGTSGTSTPSATPDATPTAATGTPSPSVTPDGTPSATPTPTEAEPPGNGGPGPTSQPPPSNGQPPPPPPPNTPRPPTSTPAALGISVVSPSEGANVGPTFTVQVAVTGIQLALGPGGALIPGAGHWHHAVDSVLNATPHGTPSIQIGPLSPGPHTITVTLNLNDSDLTVVAIGQVTVNVQ